MRPTAAVVSTAIALTLALAACSDDDPPAASTTAGGTSEETAAGTSSPSSTSASSDDAGAAEVPRPAPGACQPVPETADGVYSIAGIGTVTVRLVAGRLDVAAEGTDGWTATVDGDEDESDVEFTRSGEDVDFEADVEAGQLVLQVCDDDD